MTSPLSFLDAISGYVRADSSSSADRTIRLATVDPAHNAFANYPDGGPLVRVTFEGESTLSGKAYPYVVGYVPRPGDRVWLVPIGNTYLICGSLNSQVLQGFWQDADGTDAGIELGGGSYYDLDDGLVIAGDISYSGDITGAGAYSGGRGMVAQASSTANSANVTVTTATNVLGVIAMLRLGRAYRVDIHSAVRRVGASTSTVVQLFGMVAGVSVARMFNVPVPNADIGSTVDTKFYIKKTSADASVNVAFGIASLTAGQAVRRDADATGPSIITVYDIGTSDDHSYGIAV